MPEVKYGNAVSQTDTAKNGGDAVSVGTSTTVVAAANKDRAELFLQNDHATQTVYLGLGQAAVANKGIRLNAAGGSIVLTSYNGAVNAIATGATTPVLVTEV